MALYTQIAVSIAGEQISVVNSFSLQEHMGNHSTFTLNIEGKSLNASDNNGKLFDTSSQFLGEDCIVRIENVAQNTEVLEFKGIVVNLQSFISKQDGDKRESVIITGKSTSICLDRGKAIKSFSEKTLSEIIVESLGNYPFNRLNVQVAPEDDITVPYTVQFEQTPFEYLQYMAAANGEFLYYAKDTLHFGKPSEEDTIELSLQNNLENLSLGVTSETAQFDFFNHNHSQGALTTSAGSENGDNGEFTSLASNASQSLFQNKGKSYYPSAENPSLQQQIDKAFKKQNVLNTQQQVILKATSYHPGVQLGKIVKIKGSESSYGTYRVSSVIHQCDDSGNYINNFEAIPTETDVYPYTNTTAKITANPQIAIVKDTNDPDGLSRIKVQYLWQQEGNETTPWIWVATSYAGANKGFHFVPEIGDTVMVGHENGNINRPYMQSALYTGQNKAEEWQTDANNVKAIRTRSGHTIELNDTEGEEKINIYDNEGSIITFDTQKKSLTINATETIDITAKNINITAEENVVIGAQQNVDIAAEGDLSTLAQGNVSIQSTGDTGIISNGALALEATTDATLQGMNAIVEGQTGAELNGVQTKITGSAMAEVSGAIVKIN